MKFTQVTFGGRTFGLLMIPPHWRSAITVKHRLDTLIGEGNTSIEERRPERATWLLGLKAQMTASGDAADDWRKGVAALGTLPVAIPLWPDALPVALWASRIYEPQKVVNFNWDSGEFALYDAASLPETLPYEMLAPLMLCRWKKRPPALPKNAEVARIDLEVEEARPWSWRIGVHSYGDGAWSELPNWLSDLRDVSEQAFEQELLSGAVSEPVLHRKNAAHRWAQEGRFVFGDRLKIRQHLSCYMQARGPWSCLASVPAWFQPGDAEGITPDEYTARFSSTEFALDFRSGDVAEAKVGFIQEVETPGRVQAKPAEALLLKLQYQHDPEHPEAYTNWDAPLTYGGITYVPAQFNIDELILSLKVTEAKVVVDLEYVEDGLAHDFQRGRLYGSLSLDLRKCWPLNSELGSESLTDGIVKSIIPNDGLDKIEARPYGNLFDREICSWIYGPKCNVSVFSTSCALSAEAHQSTATIHPEDISDDGLTVTLGGVAGWGGPAYAAQWFAPNGRLRTGSGRGYIAVDITGSETVAGELKLTLKRAIWPDLLAAGGQTVVLLPGCGGQHVTDCIGKYNNGANHRGFSTAPDYIEEWAVKQPKQKK